MITRISNLATRLLPAISTCCVTLLCLNVGVQAAVSTWNGTNGDFNTASNWSTNSVPSGTAGTTNFLINSGTATDNSTANLTLSGGDTVSGNGALVLTNARFLANDASTTGTFTVSGNGMLNQKNGAYFIVAEGAGGGTFIQSGGVVNSNISGAWFLSDNSGSGSYLLSGGSLNVVTAGNPEANSNYSVQFGKNSSSDLFLVDGGTASFTATAPDSRTYISEGATLEVDSGAASFNNFRYITIGRNNAAGTTSKVVVNGGTLGFLNLSGTATTAPAGVSVANSNNGQITLNGGTIDITGTAGSGAGLWLGDAAATNSNVTGSMLEYSGTLSINGPVILSRAAGSNGLYDMFGGELDATTISIGTGSNPLFDFQGGEIFLTGDQTSIIDNSWFEAAQGTTATFNATTNTTEIAVVPEPGTSALLLLTLPIAWAARRRFLKAS